MLLNNTGQIYTLLLISNLIHHLHKLAIGLVMIHVEYIAKIFFLICFLCMGLTVYAQKNDFSNDIQGSWTGYMIDLMQIREDKLPSIYAVKMIINKTSPIHFSGVVNTLVSAHYNTITRVVGTYDTSKNMLSFGESGLFRADGIDTYYSNCKILSSLSVFLENGKIVMDGRYYGVDNKSIQKCPVGRIHLERPSKDSASFSFLAEYLKKRPIYPAQSTVLSPNITVLTNTRGISTSDTNAFLYFPKMIVYTNTLHKLQTNLQYDIVKLAETQQLLKVKQPLLIKEKKFTVVLSSAHKSGDTINLFFNGIKIATNHVLKPSSSITMKMDFSEIPPKIINGLHSLIAIVPFSWTKKKSHINVEVFSDTGKRISTVDIHYASNRNLEIALKIKTNK